MFPTGSESIFHENVKSNKNTRSTIISCSIWDEYSPLYAYDPYEQVYDDSSTRWRLLTTSHILKRQKLSKNRHALFLLVFGSQSTYFNFLYIILKLMLWSFLLAIYQKLKRIRKCWILGETEPLLLKNHFRSTLNTNNHHLNSSFKKLRVCNSD